ncbi:MAG: hypothetical protein K940chlam1_01291, partial [Candidatus Anoxychlamydiales bacterium]|nr:hypothetical protein [Candidatus Anoxychlamydiales bacterium]
MSSPISRESTLEILNSDIQFSFERGDAYDDKIKVIATYISESSITKRVLLSEEYQIPSSYHPTGFSKGCILFLTTGLCIVGPVTIKAGLETNNTLKIIVGIGMSTIFVISTIFSCGLMIRGEMGIKKFKAYKIEELLPLLKE